MPSSSYKCPHCGKELISPDKLAWHLSRECPVWAARAPSQDAANDPAKSEPNDRQR